MENKFLYPTENDREQRLDVYIASKLPELSRSAAAKYIDDGLVTSCGKSLKKNSKIIPGSCIEIALPELSLPDAEPEDIPLDIVYEDSELLVVNKVQGMVVHPAVGNYSGTLVNALLAHCGESLSGINGVARPGIVHRIDKETSGLLIVAKTDRAHASLAEQIAVHSFDREYRSIVYGTVKDDGGVLSFPIARAQSDRKKMAVDPKGRTAVTHYTVVQRFPAIPATYLRLKLETGRTHQIRVHMSHIGHPVLGDKVYCNRSSAKLFKELSGQCLHAGYIAFTHPITGERMSFESELPDYFNRVLEGCRAASDV